MESVTFHCNVCVFACLYVLLFLSECHAQCLSFLNPTSNLREVVISKCTVYQEIVNQPQFCDGNTYKPRNCTEVWEAFSTAFLYKPRCNVSDTEYADYMTLTDHPTPPNKSLFWENVYPFVHRFSHKGAKYSTLSDTLTGYIGNQLQWCSDPVKGMSMAPETCPEWDPTPSCPQHAVRAFWIAASRKFGQRANGEIQIMLNTKTNPIFEEHTYLAVYELPFLTQKVTKATVLLLNENPVPNQSKCQDSSLSSLERMMRNKNIEYACVENRKDVAQLFCLDNPSSKLCETRDTNIATYREPSLLLVAILVLWQLIQNSISVS